MTTADILQLRLRNQLIAASQFTTPRDVVAWMGAIQAQDYPGALWSIGLRLPGASLPDIERAVADRQIVRTWPMRGTLHFVAADDIRWMVELMAPRVITSTAHRDRNLEIDESTYDRSRKIFTDVLQGDRQITRTAMCALLESAGISTEGYRGTHVLCRLCQEGLLCFGPHSGKEPTFALLADWAPNAHAMPRPEAITEITRRYFNSHGPATVKDFTGWTGLTVGDAKIGLAANADTLVSMTVDGKTYWMGQSSSAETGAMPSVYLLPGFDEYVLGYKERGIIVDDAHGGKIVPGNNGIFLATILINGKIEGLWKRKTSPKRLTISAIPFESFSEAQRKRLIERATQYGQFLGANVVVS